MKRALIAVVTVAVAACGSWSRTVDDVASGGQTDVVDVKTGEIIIAPEEIIDIAPELLFPETRVDDAVDAGPDTGLEVVLDTGIDTGPDIPPILECEPGEGCFFDKCDAGSDCQSGWCVDHMGEGVCTKTCQEECPAGWTCTLVVGTEPDLVFVCVSDYPNLCRPCSEADDCAGVAGTEDVCLDYGEEGYFCGGGCIEDGVCPWGCSCENVVTRDGVETVQCVSDVGYCFCTTK